jgi:hypothetical protein
MPHDHYDLSETEVDQLREFFDSFQGMIFELIESRRVKVNDWPERQNYASIYEKLDHLAQEKFDF